MKNPGDESIYSSLLVHAEEGGELEAHARADAHDVTFDSSLADIPRSYGDAIREGALMATERQSRQSGVPYRVSVDAVELTAVDSSPDVVRCAAAVATWKSFGHGESEVVLFLRSGRWEIDFAAGNS